MRAGFPRDTRSQFVRLSKHLFAWRMTQRSIMRRFHRREPRVNRATIMTDRGTGKPQCDGCRQSQGCLEWHAAERAYSERERGASQERSGDFRDRGYENRRGGRCGGSSCRSQVERRFLFRLWPLSLVTTLCASGPLLFTAISVGPLTANPAYPKTSQRS